ncbi:MAG TPA: hypothetical protein VHA57_09625 [Actinomycetota bacterium]|nr:hypothetical protein [Actinomycetota bacterium]
MTASDPTVVAAVRRALAEQTVLVLTILAAMGLAAALWAARRARADRALPPAADRGSPPPAEPTARRLLRVGFGALWIIDGALQLQPSMALGVVPRVIQPAASGSPGWARHLASLATATWSYHPVSVASAIVWVEIGLGAGLVMSSRGRGTGDHRAGRACRAGVGRPRLRLNERTESGLEALAPAGAGSRAPS